MAPFRKPSGVFLFADEISAILEPEMDRIGFTRSLIEDEDSDLWDEPYDYFDFGPKSNLPVLDIEIIREWFRAGLSVYEAVQEALIIIDIITKPCCDDKR